MESKIKLQLGVTYKELYHEYLFDALDEVRDFIEFNERYNVNNCTYTIDVIIEE